MIQRYSPPKSQEKSAWKSRPLESINKIVLHHTAKLFTSGKRTSTYKEIDRIAHAHIARDWGKGAKAPTIAYHFVIDRIGRIYKLNDIDHITWHAREANSNSISVLVLGNYEKQKPTILTKRAILRLSHYIFLFLKIPLSNWTWHDEAQKAPTICCGKNLINLINHLKATHIHSAVND